MNIPPVREPAAQPLGQDELRAIDAWWRGQDATRTPRFDLFAFSCGAQLDISDVKLPNTTAELSSIDGRFQKIIIAVYFSREAHAGLGMCRP